MRQSKPKYIEWSAENAKFRAVVRDITWQDTIVTLLVKLEGIRDLPYDESIFTYLAVNRNGRLVFCFDKKRVGEHSYALSVNVSNIGEQQAVLNGTYCVLVAAGEEILSECDMTIELGRRLSDVSRIFPYNHYKNAFLTTFQVKDSDELIYFEMLVRNYKEAPLEFESNTDWNAKIRGVPDHARNDLRYNVRKDFKKLCKRHRTERAHTVLFLTTRDTELSAGLLAVREAMRRLDAQEYYTILTYAKAIEKIPNKEKNWSEILDILSRAGTIFVEDVIGNFQWLPLPEDARLIRLSGERFFWERGGYRAWTLCGDYGPQSALRQYAHAITASEAAAEIDALELGLDAERMLPLGRADLDAYGQADARREIAERARENLSFSSEKRLLVFAPKARPDAFGEPCYPFEQIDFAALFAALGESGAVALCTDLPVSEAALPERYADRICVLPEAAVRDLLCCADLFLTDYTAYVDEAAVLAVSTLFYAYDFEKYAVTQGLDFSFLAEAPGKICASFSEVVQAIEAGDFAKERQEAYVEKYLPLQDGKVAERIVRTVFDGLE